MVFNIKFYLTVIIIVILDSDSDEEARDIDYQAAIEKLRRIEPSVEKSKLTSQLKDLKSKQVDEEYEAFNCMWDSSLKSGDK